MKLRHLLACASLASACATPPPVRDGAGLYRYQSGSETRWVSPENPTGAKGHAFETIPVGRSHTLADMQGAGTIDRMWLTLEDRSPDALRGLPAIAPAAERTADLRPPAEKK